MSLLGLVLGFIIKYEPTGSAQAEQLSTRSDVTEPPYMSSQDCLLNYWQYKIIEGFKKCAQCAQSCALIKIRETRKNADCRLFYDETTYNPLFFFGVQVRKVNCGFTVRKQKINCHIYPYSMKYTLIQYHHQKKNIYTYIIKKSWLSYNRTILVWAVVIETIESPFCRLSWCYLDNWGFLWTHGVPG